MKTSTRIGICLLVLFALAEARPARAQGDWETTPESELALKKGLDWLAKNQGPEGNWGNNNLGLVSLGALSFLAAGHSNGIGTHGKAADRALDYVLRNAKPSGLLNVGNPGHDMYNHGLSTFVLGQAHGMTRDPRLSPALDRALKLIVATQCNDGGWDYRAKAQTNGHDLSLAVMQAKALRSAVDSGLDVPPHVIGLAIKSVREHYSPEGGLSRASEAEQQKVKGQFTYGKGGGSGTVAMAAAGVVCLQEFGQYDDWRIPKSMQRVTDEIKKLPAPGKNSGQLPFDAYTLYYVGQALYQVNGTHWQENYPRLRDHLVASQRPDGSWGDGHGPIFGTSVACFVLAIPNRYLPILQEGKIDSLRGKIQPQ